MERSDFGRERESCEALLTGTTAAASQMRAGPAATSLAEVRALAREEIKARQIVIEPKDAAQAE